MAFATGLEAPSPSRDGRLGHPVATGLVLVEPLASQRGGHPHQSLRLLLAAAARAGRPVTVVAVNGIDGDIHASLEPYGAKLVASAPRRGPGAVLVRCGRLLAVSAQGLQRRFPERSLPWQLDLFARCLIEAGSLRIGRAALGADGRHATAVVLTANITLHACAAALGGQPHLRYLHDLSRTESRAIRAVEWLTSRALRRTYIFCPTPSIQAALRRRYRRANAVVRTFALNDPEAAPQPGERERARSQLGLPGPPSVVGSLIGGWWKVKDNDTVVRALAEVTRPLTLLVAGYRMDERILGQMASNHCVKLHVIPRALTSAELRQVYAASDFTIVSRSPGGKESGVAYDALLRGVPAIVSDHDPSLTRRLDRKPWARVFRCGDFRSLAYALNEASIDPMPRPPRDAATQLGMIQAEEMLELFDDAAACVRAAIEVDAIGASGDRNGAGRP